MRHASHEEWGVRYGLVGKGDHVMAKQRFFASEDKRDRFIEELVDQKNFTNILGYSDPSEG
jgi:hypothetical protein